MTEFEVRQQILVNRLRKVPKLIAALDVLLEHDWDAALVASTRLNDPQWEGLAIRADVTPPSETTRKMVVDALRNRIRIRNRFAGRPNVLGL